jgi:5-(carboxyamino)imidazole ribonucleotide synthase
MTLGDPHLTCQGAVMVNLLGYETAQSDYLEQRQRLAALPHSHLHWYGKSQSRPGRKLGHVTVLLPTASRPAAEQIVGAIEEIWYPHG